LTLVANAEEQSAGQFLLDAFGSQCSGTITSQVRAALSNTDNLISVVKRLRDSEKCSGANSLASSLNSYNGVITNYTFYQSSKMAKLSAETKLGHYALILTDPGLTTAEKDYFNTQILATQTELINASSNLAPFSEISGRHAESANQLVSSVGSFLATLQNNPQCFKSSSNTISALLSDSLMATSAFAAPGSSLALATGAAIISTLGQFFSNYTYNKVLRNLDDGKMPAAIRCVSETLSNLYCDNVEAGLLITDYQNDDATHELKYPGLELLMFDLQNLGSWLNEVYAGSAISSEGDLVNRTSPIAQAQFLENVYRFLGTFSSIRKNTVFKDKSGLELTTAIAQAVDGLVSIMENPTLNPERSFEREGTFVNPIFLGNSKKLLAFKLIDPTITSVPKCNANDECSSVTQWLRTKDAPNPPPANFEIRQWDNFVDNALILVQNILSEVNRQRAQVISVDPYQVMVKATRKTKGANAQEALKLIVVNANRISDYLYKLGCQENPESCKGNSEIVNPYYPQLKNIEKTKDLTNTVLSLLNMAFSPAALNQVELPKACQVVNAQSRSHQFIQDNNQNNLIDEKSSIIASCITTILKLAERGNDVYFTKINEMVSYELEARYAQPQDKDQLKEILYSTKGNLVESLKSTYNSGNIALEQVSTGLEAAMTLNKKTLNEFSSLFSDKIIDILKGREKIGPLEKTNFCFSVLPFLNEDNSAIGTRAFAFCKDVTIKAKGVEDLIWKNFINVTTEQSRTGKSGMSYNETVKLNVKTEAERMCALRNFYRKASLIQQKKLRR